MQPHRRNLLNLIALGHAWTVLRRQGSSDDKSSYLTEIKDNVAPSVRACFTNYQ